MSSLIGSVGEFHIPVKPGTFWWITYPCARRHGFTNTDIARIVDLVPNHDPDPFGNMLGCGNRIPVRCRHVLHPAHPDGVVDMAQFVYVGG